MKTLITISIDADVKEKSQEILKENNQGMSFFVNQSLKKLIEEKSTDKKNWRLFSK